MAVDAIQNNSIFQTTQKVQSQISRTESMSGMDKVDHQMTEQILHDEYISSEKSLEKPSGLYKIAADEDGKPKILYDDFKKSFINPKKDNEDEMSKHIQSDNSDDKSEECTTNTNKVDHEIEKLKEKRKQLEQQIKAAAGDEETIKELKKKLASIESELNQKDNDTYRRQHADIS